MRVLIVLPGALGDVVRALPLAGRLRRAWPEAHVAWAVEPLSAPLLRGHPWIDEVRVFERSRGARAFLPFLGAVRAARYDLALDLGRSIKSALIARSTGAPVRVGFAPRDGREGSWLFVNRHLPPQGPNRSKLQQFLAFGDVLGLPPAAVEFGLAPSTDEQRDAELLTAGLPRPLVAACLGSSCPSRRWFPERTAAVLRALASRHGAGALLVGTAADAAFGTGIVRQTTGVRDLVGRTTLRQLLAVLASVDLVFGPDSGALHLGAALGRPVVSLWGATSAARSAPVGGEHLVVTGAAPCAPCFLRHCPIGRVCMQAIAVDTVLARADEALAA